MLQFQNTKANVLIFLLGKLQNLPSMRKNMFLGSALTAPTALSEKQILDTPACPWVIWVVGVSVALRTLLCLPVLS